MALVTERLARLKWCPFVMRLSVASAAVVINRDVDDRPIGRCIGSDCMAWRWQKEDRSRTEASQGYCGLAGSWRDD